MTRLTLAERVILLALLGKGFGRPTDGLFRLAWKMQYRGKPHRENAMKRNRTLPLALVTFAALTFASNAAWANHHWGNNNGMGNQGYSQLTQEQQATVQKLHNDYYAQTSALRQQLQSKRYEYNALLTAQKPEQRKIEAVAQEMEGLRQKLDQQRVKFDIALAEAGVPRGAGMGYGGCRGSAGGHMGMNHW